ncbi:adenosine deaminase [Plantactinospora endophytica]|uniref:Adenosine/adenine deaminase n=1 Tax=Plantactinospora endophytica TaxID=673535 RepID=A0ABQ4EDP4_9ACTN|nr:adenosine deaminase [Plantactinospora endophytica]GIG92844.1 putative adenosine/adenine deaminase [Plantactinospora endophytica]
MAPVTDPLAHHDLRRLPKTNLHLHLTGSMRPTTLAELADRHGLALPEPLPVGTVSGWAAFQGRYELARAALRTGEDLGRVVAEATADNLADGAGWVEIQVDPTTYAERLGGLEPVVEAVLAGAAGGRTGVVLAASWAGPPAQADRIARLAARYAGHGVVGFGLSNDERRGRVADFVPAMRTATEAGLLAVPHSGFYEAAWHVRDCVTRLGAHRVGHGLSAVHDPATLELLAERGVAMEVCPSSYPPFGVTSDLAATPLRALLTAGVPVALGTDDPLLFGTNLLDQYALARDVLGCTGAELAGLARSSVTASAAPPELRAAMLAGVEEWLGGMDQDSGSVCYIGAPSA